jgi:hypothetical protein
MLIPRRDSIAYHIKGYKTAERRLYRTETFMDRAVMAWIQEVQREDPYASAWNDLKYHQQELIRLRYLEERTFVFPNVALSNVGFAVQRAITKKGIKKWVIYSAGMDRERTNGVRVVTLKEHMPTPEEVLREVEAAKIKQ